MTAMPAIAVATPTHHRPRSRVPRRIRSSNPATIGPVPMLTTVAAATPSRPMARKNPSWNPRNASAPTTIDHRRKENRQGG